MKIFPGVHYTMGGLWTTYTAKDDLRGMEPGAPDSMMTNVAGLYAFGEVNYQYHGATRLGANALLSCIFDGLFCGAGVAAFARGRDEPAADADAAPFDEAVRAEQAIVDALVASDGDENPYRLGVELGEEMTAAATVVKIHDRMTQALERLREFKTRFGRVRLADTGAWTNQNLSYARSLGDMLRLAEVILVGGIERQESRGSHYRTDYPDRDDARFLKTTVAEYDAEADAPKLWYEPVETGLVPPRPRTYGKVDQKTAATT
jgi:succinate dehydrogenase / fumarate reductase flavoprotein subunit